ncbi:MULTISPECIES: sigma factor-like helix-turn-helix DNA-binding protein [unclassified Streptomyces]|uniref:sigma factor-like helix-turn-helix DNA-binding protein n=1 Tax=unclassified Streptomyces TaxID=2593676 RepID=UPI00380E41D2
MATGSRRAQGGALPRRSAAPDSGDRLVLAAFRELHREVYVRWAERRLPDRADAEEAVDRVLDTLELAWGAALSSTNAASYAWRLMRTTVAARAGELPGGRAPAWVALADAARLRVVLGSSDSSAEAGAPVPAVGTIGPRPPVAADGHAPPPRGSVCVLLALARAFSTLPDLQHDVLLLRHCEYRTVAETAHHLGVAEPLVSSAEHQARRRLRLALAGGAEGLLQVDGHRGGVPPSGGCLPPPAALPMP